MEIRNKQLDNAEVVARTFIDAIENFIPEFKSVAIEYVLEHFKYCRNCGECGCEGWCVDSEIDSD